MMQGKIKRRGKEIVIDPIQGGAYPLSIEGEEYTGRGVYLGFREGRNIFLVYDENEFKICETEECVLRIGPFNHEVICVDLSGIPVPKNLESFAKEIFEDKNEN